MQIHNPAPTYDVVIVGGGMVGASFACALNSVFADASISILIVEAITPNTASTTQPGFDARSTALSYGSSEIYSQAGLWSRLQNLVTPIKEIQISDKGRFGSAHITSAEQKVDALGYVIENQDLGLCLHSALEESPNLQLLSPATIQTTTPIASGMSMQIKAASGRHTVKTKLLVLADGGRSPICRQLGISHLEEPYQQQALIANIAFEKPHQNIAYERFTDTGPLAVLPLADIDTQHRGSLVWTLGEQQVAEFQSLSEAELISRLQERFGNRLGQIQRIGECFNYPLNLSVATEQARPGLVLLGNVAHTLHPVAGQGLNLALRDAQALASILRTASAAGQELGAMPVLQQYLQAQRADQERAINFTDYATRLFSSNHSAKVLGRKIGLLAIDLLPALRREFAKQAMGLAPRS